MGYEILTERIVRVRRPDAEELLAIRHGSWSYERLLEYAREMEAKIIEAEKKSDLPATCEVNREKIEDLQIRLIREAVRKAPGFEF
jgi:hypothetical protein